MRISKVMDIGIVIRLRDKFSDLMTEKEKDALHELIMFYQDHLSKELDTSDDTDFDAIWVMYQRKGNKKKSKDRWDKLTKKDKSLIQQRIQYYIDATPEIQYRKGLEVYINNKCWNDVVRDRWGNILFDPDKKVTTPTYNDYNRPNGLIENGRMWDANKRIWIII